MNRREQGVGAGDLSGRCYPEDGRRLQPQPPASDARPRAKASARANGYSLYLVARSPGNCLLRAVSRSGRVRTLAIFIAPRMPDKTEIQVSIDVALPAAAFADLTAAGIAVTPNMLTVPVATYDEALELVRKTLARHTTFVTFLYMPPDQVDAAQTKARNRRRATLGIRLAISVACLASAFFGHKWQWDTPLLVALLVTGGFEIVATAGYWLWAKSSFAQADQHAAAADATAAGAGPSNAYADAAKVALTTQGVVLGLIAFKEGSLNTTLKVGASSLAAGVLLSAFLYFNVVLGDPSTQKQRFAAAIILAPR